MISRRQWIGGTAGAVVGCGLRPVKAADGFAVLPAFLARLEKERGGRLGVAVLDTDSGRQVGHRMDERFPIGSTFKMLAAAAVLARADAGQDSMERRVRFTKEDLVTYSPITERWAGCEGMTLDAVCDAAITYSDNTAGNLLLRAIGGPPGLTAYLRSLGDGVTRLDRFEPVLNEAVPGDPRDTTSPGAMLADLRTLTVGDALSASAKLRLLNWLRHNTTGDKRLRAKLPKGWEAGEKTGTSSYNTSNDVGLLWPPQGAAPVMVAAYLTEGPADGVQRDAILADVGSAVAYVWTG